MARRKALHFHEMRSHLGRRPKKVGSNHSAASVRKECEDSLRRLPNRSHSPLPDALAPSDNGPSLEEAWTAMAALQKEGKVRWIGVSNFNAAQIRRAQAIAPVTSNQPPYSVIRRAIEAEALPFCAQQGIGTLATRRWHLVFSPGA